ncbi:hypothetical protein J6590_105195, partial [Homalodisca vitripennis]
YLEVRGDEVLPVLPFQPPPVDCRRSYKRGQGLCLCLGDDCKVETRCCLYLGLKVFKKAELLPGMRDCSVIRQALDNGSKHGD